VVVKPAWIDDPDITGEHEVDIGLRRKPMVGRFVKGPIPLDRVVRAAQLPGKALCLLLLIYYRTGASGTEWVTIPRSLLDEVGINREAKRRALRHLEYIGMIHIKQTKGYQTKVRLRPVRKLSGRPKCKAG
jgi:hypothetical protein